MSVLFSVIIPTHNRPEFLADSLACLQRQNPLPYQVLIINNGTRDFALADVLGAGAAADMHARLVRTVTDAGPGQARNMGATLANGDYLAFLDDDDWWANDYLERMRKEIEAREPDMLLASVSRVRRDAVETPRIPPENWDRVNLFRENPGITGSSLVVRRTRFLQTSGFDARLLLGEDKLLVEDFLRAEFSVRVVREAISYHRDHDEGRLTDYAKMGARYRMFAMLLRPRMSRTDYCHVLKRATRAEARANPGPRTRLAHAFAGIRYALTRALNIFFPPSGKRS